MIKENTWLADLVKVYELLGGEARYSDVYEEARKIRLARGASWTKEAKASIRRTVEDHSEDSKNYRGKDVFYSVKGLGKGVWGLLPEYRASINVETKNQKNIYEAGIEGIVQELHYLKKTRDPRLVQARKIKDDYKCQACGYKKKVAEDKYIIEVHHLNPIGKLRDINITRIEELICLCPNCHRIAHSNMDIPLSINEIKEMLSNGK